MTDPTNITHEVAAEAFCDAFRRRVGLGPGKVRVDDLADAIEIDARTVKAWRDGETVPQFHKLLRLCAHFGPAFTSEILHPTGQGGVDTMETVAVDAQGTATDLVETAGDLLERLRDGCFCHQDRLNMGPRLIELGREIEAQGRAMSLKREEVPAPVAHKAVQAAE